MTYQLVIGHVLVGFCEGICKYQQRNSCADPHQLPPFDYLFFGVVCVTRAGKIYDVVILCHVSIIVEVHINAVKLHWSRCCALQRVL